MTASICVCVEALRADEVEDLPIEVIEMLEELLPSFDPSMITAVSIESKELIHVDCLVGPQMVELRMSNLGELLWMRRNLPDHDKGPLIDINSGNEIDVSQLPVRILHDLRRKFPEIYIHRILTITRRDHWHRMFRIEAENLGAEMVMVINKHGHLIEYSLDSDSDGICDVVEIEKGWDPQEEDTDKDGFPDGVEDEFGGNPANSKRIPTLLQLCHDCTTKVVVITAQTFRGSEFFLEVSSTGMPGDWVRLGEAIPGDGAAHNFSIPSDGACRMTMFRLGINAQEGGAKVRKDDGADDSGDCLVPDSLIGREIIVGEGKRLFFTARHRGELIEETSRGMIVTPFSFTFGKAGHCKARVVLTFSVRSGFETTVYNLTFTVDGDSGIFVASEYEKGNMEDSFDGTFTISMNP